jgi:hypothetical protein
MSNLSDVDPDTYSVNQFTLDGLGRCPYCHHRDVDAGWGRVDMTRSETEISRVLQSLQDTATVCANTFTTAILKVEYRIAFSLGAALPWRLLELHYPRPRNDKPYTLRRMHCFRTPDGLRRSIQERTKWRACDQELVASYLVKVGSSSDAPIEGEPNRQASGSVRRSLDLSELRPARLALRAQMCTTRPERVVDLMHG